MLDSLPGSPLLLRLEKAGALSGTGRQRRPRRTLLSTQGRQVCRPPAQQPGGTAQRRGGVACCSATPSALPNRRDFPERAATLRRQKSVAGGVEAHEAVHVRGLAWGAKTGRPAPSTDSKGGRRGGWAPEAVTVVGRGGKGGGTISAPHRSPRRDARERGDGWAPVPMRPPALLDGGGWGGRQAWPRPGAQVATPGGGLRGAHSSRRPSAFLARGGGGGGANAAPHGSPKSRPVAQAGRGACTPRSPPALLDMEGGGRQRPPPPKVAPHRTWIGVGGGRREGGGHRVTMSTPPDVDGEGGRGRLTALAAPAPRPSQFDPPRHLRYNY